MRPSDFNLPHDTFRPHQLETIQWLLGLELDKKAAIVSAPTGSGKTSYPAAYAKDNNVFALCRTKNLQEVNYKQYYGATVMYGKGEYSCANPLIDTSDNCPLSGPKDCEYICEHDIARCAARSAQFVCLNYKYFLSNLWPRENKRTLFCDEAHQMSDLVLDHVSFTISSREKNEWYLPDFPNITGHILLDEAKSEKVALQWLERSYRILSLKEATLQRLKRRNFATPEDIKRLKMIHSLLYKVKYLTEALRDNESAWFIRSGSEVGESKKPGFLVRPLTARYHFPVFFKKKVIAMSATIGKPETFAEELGISDYDYTDVPNQFPASVRPVYLLDAPKMSYRSTEKDYDAQADCIAKAILDCPEEWSGLLHVNAKRQAEPLARRLSERGLEERIWIMPGYDGIGIPTKEQVALWHTRLAKVPNSLCITWSLTEGYDGLDEKICIATKVPFPSLGDEYERARLAFSEDFYLQRTAWTLEQTLGRTRRGRKEDYDFDCRNGFVAIADGNWCRVKDFLSESMQDSLIAYS